MPSVSVIDWSPLCHAVDDSLKPDTIAFNSPILDKSLLYNNDLANKQDEIETVVGIADNYNLDILSEPGVYSCYCTIFGILARYLIRNIVEKIGSVLYYRQIAIPYMGNSSYVFTRYTRHAGDNSIEWTGWTPIDAFQFLNNSITNIENSITSINNSITALNQKFDNHENNGEISDCNYAPSGVSMAVSTTINSPTPGTGFFILWTMSTGAATNPAKLQIASAYSNDYYYFRDMFNGSWSNWKRLDLS